MSGPTQGPTRGPVQVVGELLSAKRLGPFCHLTMVVPGVAERFRPGTTLAVAVGGTLRDRTLRRNVPIYRVRSTGPYGGTVEVVLQPSEPGLDWLARLPAGAPVDVVGPLGRPYALPKEPVTCTLVGTGHRSAPLFALAERLRERGCPVHMVLGASTGSDLFGALEAKRAARSVLVCTDDGTVGVRGSVADQLPGLLERTGTEVVYAAGPTAVLHEVAAVAERHGAWSQTALEADLVCATGACLTCVVPAVGEDGATRMLRTCTDGPVFRGDRVRWDDLGTVPADVRGAPRVEDAG